MYQQINQRRDRTQRREQPCKQQLWQRGWKDKEKTKRSKEKVDGPTRNRKAKKQQSSNRMSRVGRLLPVVITSIADFDDDDDWRSASCHFTRCKRKETDRSASHWSLLAAPSSVLGHWLRTAALTLSREKFIGESVKAPAHSTKCNAGHADCRVFRSACKEKSARFQNIQQHCC